MTGAGRLSGLLIRAPFGDRDSEILTPDALGFLQTLVRHHRGPIRSALTRRSQDRALEDPGLERGEDPRQRDSQASEARQPGSNREAC
jgi:hypothetical protein